VRYSADPVLDRAVLEGINQVMGSARPDKFEALDRLQIFVMDNHPDGLSADVLQEISDAQTRCLYTEGGDAKR
jgi:hypothetical protein